MQRGDQGSQLVRPVRLAVPEQYAGQVGRWPREGEKLADRERMHPALRKVVVDPVLVGGLPAFHLEGGEFHRSVSLWPFVCALPRARLPRWWPACAVRLHGENCSVTVEYALRTAGEE